MSDLIYIGKDVQSFKKSNRFEPYDRVVLNLDDNYYVSSPSVSVTNASVYDNYANGTYTFTYSPDESKWETPTHSYVTSSELESTYGLTVHYSDVTSPKSGDVITVTKTTVDNESKITVDMARSGSALRANCPLVKPSDRQKVADNLLKRVYGFAYQPYSAKGAYMNPAAEIGDAITAYNVFSGLFEQDTTFNRLFLSDIGSALSEEAAIEMQYETNTDRRYNRKLAETAAQFSILSDRISSFVTNQAFQAALEVMANQISAKVSGTGGDANSFAWSLSTDGFNLYADGNLVFKCDRNGITVNGNGTFTGEVYASNIRSDAVSGYGGSFNGGGITGGSIAPAQCSEGIVQSLGYAELYNSATQRGTSLYPDYFTAGSVYALSSVASRTFSVENASGEEAYHLNDHYHSFVERDGKIIIGIPHNDAAIDRRSFNIADTETYKAAVPASRAVLYCNATNYTDVSTGFDCDMTGASYHYDVNGVTYGRIAIRNSSGTDLKTIRVKLPGATTTPVDIDHASVLATSASTYGQYDSGYNFGIGSNLYLSGSTLYGRIGIYDSNSTLLKTMRIVLPIALKSASTAYDYSDYYMSGGRWYLTVHVKSGSTELYSQGIDVQQAVDYGASSATGVSVRSIKALTNKTYDPNMDMYYVNVRVTYSDGSTQQFQAWYD